MNRSQHNLSVVVLRTESALLRGKLRTPSRMRLSGHMNGPTPTVDLTEATMKDGPRSTEKPVGNLSVPKRAVLYVFLTEEEKKKEVGAYGRYEQEAIEGRLSDEPYFLHLGPGVGISGRIFGGTHTVMRPRSSFTSLDDATVHDRMLGPKARKPQTTVINVEQVECCYPVGETD